MYIRRVEHDFLFQNHPPPPRRWKTGMEPSLIEKLIRFQSWKHSLNPYLLKLHN